MIRMDGSDGSDSICHNIPGCFTRGSVGKGVESAVLNMTTYVCVQLLLLSSPYKSEAPNIVWLLLQKLNNGFRRVGLVSYDILGCDSMEWKRKLLKLY
jgi:hypothetical protein